MNQSSDPNLLETVSDGPHRFTELLRSFRIAIHPGKLLPALLMVVLLYIAGRMLDGMGFGEAVYPHEIAAYVVAEDTEQFDAWMTATRMDNANQLIALLQSGARLDRAEALATVYEIDDEEEGDEKEDDEDERKLRSDRYRQAQQLLQEQFGKRQEEIETNYAGDSEGQRDAMELYRAARQKAEADLRALRPQGVFAATLDFKLAAVKRIMTRAVDPAIITDAQARAELVDAAEALVMLPAWLWHAHPVFLVIWLMLWLVVWSLLGGAISRMAIFEAARDERLTLSQALSFVRKRWVSYLAAPLAPVAIIGLAGLLLAALGVFLFQWVGSVIVIGWVTDILAGLLFILALLLGFLMAMVLVGYAFGLHLMYPALSAEGSDAFDAISRGYSYVYARPWRLLGYGLVSLVYGAATYLFVGAMIFLTLYLTHAAVGCFDGGISVDRFETMMPEPRFGELAMQSDLDALNWSGLVATFLIRVWVYLAIGLVAAYAISYYFSATSTIYLLLRRRCDGTDMGQCFVETDDGGGDRPTAAAEKTVTSSDAQPDLPNPVNPEPADET